MHCIQRSFDVGVKSCVSSFAESLEVTRNRRDSHVVTEIPDQHGEHQKLSPPKSSNQTTLTNYRRKPKLATHLHCQMSHQFWIEA